MNFKVGGVAREGEFELVTFTGTICTTGSKQPLPADLPVTSRYCRTNSDPHTNESAFTTRLMMEKGAWEVVLP